MDHWVLQQAGDTSSLSRQGIFFTILLSVSFTPFPSKQMHSVQDIFFIKNVHFQGSWLQSERLSKSARANCLGWFHLPGMDPTLSIHLLLFCDLWCYLQSSVWVGRCIAPRDRVHRQHLHFLQTATHPRSYTRIWLCSLVFWVPIKFELHIFGCFCGYSLLFCSQFPSWTLDNEVGYLAL